MQKMTINPDNLQVGKCYKTVYDHNRRISEIGKDIIVFESWGGTKGLPQGHRTTTILSRATFAQSLISEIDCPQ